MKDVGCPRLHTSDVNRIEMFMIKLGVGILPHDQLTILDLDILRIVFHVKSNVGIVRVLLEIIDHP